MLLEIDGLEVEYATSNGRLRALAGVGLSLDAGETLGVVGESGCGKSTLGRAILGLVPKAGGTMRFQGATVGGVGSAGLVALRARAAMVFQDPAGSLNPRRSVGTSIAQPLRLAGVRVAEAHRRVGELLADVGLPPSAADRYPHEFSGGQRQRIGIARALANDPMLLICDEAVAALDVSVRAQVVNLLRRLQGERGIAILFISHDLAIVEHIAHRVMVMYLGRVMEVGPAAALMAQPLHPYTLALLDAAPLRDPGAARAREAGRVLLAGELPSPAAPPSGCVFRTRCPRAEPVCAAEVPVLRAINAGRTVACHFPQAVPV